MKVLVAGAGGFLGRCVTEHLARRGHRVRAMLRPAATAPEWGTRVEVVRAELRGEGELAPALDDMDAVVHLAAAVGVDEDTMFASTVVGTERLLLAMARSPVRRLVFASSFVVYDWARARGTLDERTPLAEDIYTRGPYDVTKWWQERLVERLSAEHGFALTILRPGFVWGPGRAAIAAAGRRVGPVHLLVGPWTRLPLTHVENCADCFARVLEHEASIGQCFNVVDDDSVRAWRYHRAFVRGTGYDALTVPVPYVVARTLASGATQLSRRLFGARGKLPSLLSLSRFEAVFKPLRYSNRKLREQLGWAPPLSFEACVRATYGEGASRSVRTQVEG